MKTWGVDVRANANFITAAIVLFICALIACGSNSHPNRLSSITLSPATASIALGQTQQFTGAGTTNSGQTITGAGATWASSNTAVATVDQNGLATAVGLGTTTISASVNTGRGTVTGSATLTVTASTLVSISVTPAGSSVPAGQTQQFTAKGTYSDNSQQTLTSATWTSDTTTVATINSSGVASALAAGTTTITATANGVNGSTTMTVTAPTLALVSIVVTPANVSITAGTTQQFTATGIYSDSSQQTLTSATWISGTTSVATINSSGLATASSLGSTTIKASAGGISGSTGMTVTAASTNAYVGTQSPGDLWSLSIDDTAKTFSATNQSASLTYSGTLTALPNGFYKTNITTTSDATLPAGTNGYALEIPGVAVVVSLSGGTGKPVAGVVAGQCPTISSTLTADLINLGHSTYDSTKSESFAVVTATQSGTNYNFTLNSYLLDGTLRTAASGPLPNPGTCSNGVITVPNVPTASGGTVDVTEIAAPNGLYVLDLGRDSLTGIGKGAAIGTTTNIDPSQIGVAMSQSYLGFVFRRNSTPITTFVGFGPGSGTSITGGTYVNRDTDPFNAHGTNFTIDLPNTTGTGLLQGTVTDPNGTHSPFIAVITNSGGKYFLFGITTDTSTATPYAVVLAQQ